jgi:hypothetical protein
MIDEFAALPAEAKAQLTILGDGQCRPTLEEQAARVGPFQQGHFRWLGRKCLSIRVGG